MVSIFLKSGGGKKEYKRPQVTHVKISAGPWLMAVTGAQMSPAGVYCGGHFPCQLTARKALKCLVQ
jgi:hypothetical protein